MTRDYGRLDRLIQSAPAIGHDQMRWCASTLTIPGDLAFLDHGLNLTLGVLDRIGPAFQECLGRFDGSTQEGPLPNASMALREHCERLLSLSDGLEVPSSDLLRKQMDGRMGRSTTPLHGRSVDSSPYWVLLFYMVDPEADRSIGEAYERLTDLVLVDLWTVSARLPPALYFSYLDQRDALERMGADDRESAEATRISKQLRSFISGTDRSRIRNAARVLRKLSDAKWRDLLLEISALDAADLPDLVRRLEDTWWERLDPTTGSDDQQPQYKREKEICDTLRLLVQTSRGPDGLMNRGQRSPGSGRKSARHTRTFLGFVRLPDSDVVFDEPETDDFTPLVAYRTPRFSKYRAEDVELLGEMNIGPDDDPARCETVYSSLYTPPDDGRMPNVSLVARQLAQRLRKSHARLRSRTNALSEKSLRKLRDWCAPSAKAPRISIEDAWIKVILATGRRPDSGQVSVLKNSPPESGVPERDEIQFLADQACWRIPVPAPAFVDEAQPTASIAVQHYVDIPDLLDFASFAKANLGSGVVSSRPFKLRGAAAFNGVSSSRLARSQPTPDSPWAACRAGFSTV